jgi:hypothetical protein
MCAWQPACASLMTRWLPLLCVQLATSLRMLPRAPVYTHHIHHNVSVTA